MLPINIGSFIWYPFAIYCMTKVYNQTGKKRAIFYISIFSALIKLTNLFMALRIDKVINPAMSILLEGVALAIIVALYNGYPNKFIKKVGFVITTNTVWRILYLGYLAMTPVAIKNVSIFVSNAKIIEHMVTKNIGTGIVLLGLMIITNNFEDKIKWNINKPIIVSLLAILNIVIELMV